MTVIVPPIKSQGIKTKLVPWINELVCRSGLDLKAANWIESFFGTGVVGMDGFHPSFFTLGSANKFALLSLNQNVGQRTMNGSYSKP